MVLTALRGAVGFLTRLPVGSDERAWHAFRSQPFVLPVVGYLVGVVVSLPFFLPLPAATVALLYLLAVVLVTGINHVDGLADLGDAAVVHGDAEKRRAVMTDTEVGVGAVVAVVVAVVGLALGAFLLASVPVRQAVGVAIAAEVGAKLGMTTLASLGRPSHEGLGSQLLDAPPAHVAGGLVLAAPASLLTWPSPAAGAAVAAGLAVALYALWWGRRYLDGVSGDVFGATNELARVAGLHAGVVVWTLL